MIELDADTAIVLWMTLLVFPKIHVCQAISGFGLAFDPYQGTEPFLNRLALGFQAGSLKRPYISL